MSLLRRSIAATAVALAAAAAPANAQYSSTFQLTGNSYGVNGPYQGQLPAMPGSPTINVICVDAFDYIYSPSSKYTVWVTNLGTGANLQYTRFGNVANALTLYRTSAVLGQQLFALPGNNDLQQTIWKTWGAYGGVAAMTSSQLALYNDAYAKANSAAVTYLGDAFFGGFQLITDASLNPNILANGTQKGPDTAAGYYLPGSKYVGGGEWNAGYQEFITTVPEPSEVALLGTGLLALGVIGVRRRS